MSRMNDRLFLRLPDELMQALNITADREYLKPSAVVRIAIREYVKSRYPDLLTNGNKPCTDTEID